MKMSKDEQLNRNCDTITLSKLKVYYARRKTRGSTSEI
jgi:hypothetical protein